MINCPVCNTELQPSKRTDDQKRIIKQIIFDYSCKEHFKLSAYENKHIFISRIKFPKFSIMGFNLYDPEGNLLFNQSFDKIPNVYQAQEWRGHTETTLDNLPIFATKAHLYLKDYLKYQAFL